MTKLLSDASDRSLSGIALLRIDVNAADDWRLKAVIPTIEYLATRARKVIVLSHKGRPAPGGRLGKDSLWSGAQKLQELVDQDVWFITDTNIVAVRKELSKIPDGTIVMLENIRAFRGESANAESFAKSLASLGDYYVSDAFPVLHHPAASVTALPRLLPAYMGLHLDEEVARLSKLQDRVRRPYVVVIGGAKAQDKLGVLETCLEKADVILIGGACANAMLALSGVKVGNSIYERDPKLLAELKKYVGHKKIVLPVDFVKGGGKILDIGPKTQRLFAKHLSHARTILWTGPLGLIEQKRFSHGSLAVAKAIAKNKAAFSVTGGGETVTFLKQHGLDKKFSFISTGGGALLDYVSGKTLPGLVALGARKVTPHVPVKVAIKKALSKQAQHAVKKVKLAPVYDLFYHNDFDGYASAAIFMEFLKENKSRVGKFVAVEYGAQFDDIWHMKDGLTKFAGEKKLNPAILVDFRYHPQAAFWYDHHATPFSREDWERNFQSDEAHIVDQSYLSAAHLIADSLTQFYGYQPSKLMRELVRWADLIDGARYASAFQTIALREAALQIDAAIGSLSRIKPEGQLRPQPLPWLAELLSTKSLEQVARDKRISTVVTENLAKVKEALSYYRKHTIVRGSVVVSDVTGFDGRTIRFAPFYLAPDAVFGITISLKSGGSLVGQVGVNPWKRERNSFNIGAILTNYNGGGHPQVGAMRLNTRAEMDRAVDYLVTLFNGSTS